ncbi:hypothetical protein [Methylomonas sp. HYX-M1]|uniref:CIS tube protein n=1 Tax=Methylomonas sp. HYX-M1 TaxID=3139307 RepID=UPI00345BEF7E
MIAIERGKLIPVSGDNDSPDLDNAIDVQFNPVSLKVSLSNTLKENARNGNSRSAQFVDKSSSTLSIELMFDTTYIEPHNSSAQGAGDPSASSGSGGGDKTIEQGSDVRLQTKKIAEAFIKPIAEGDKLKAPKRCLFQWGAFEFLGLVQSFDETLDFFSPEGRPLRATVSLKLSEDRYQFRNREVEQAERDTPSLSPAGAGPVPGGSGDQAGNWRDNSLYNGIESPRLPEAPVLALPKIGIDAAIGFSADFGVSAGIGIGLGIEGGIGLNVGISPGGRIGANPSLAGANSAAPGSVAGATAVGSGGAANTAAKANRPVPGPAFKYGNSSRLGTGIEGAFSPAGKPSGLTAAALQSGSVALRSPAASTVSAAAKAGAASAAKPTAVTTATRSAADGGSRSGVSVTALLKTAADSGVGFD